jgi:gamma-glutamylcyclotransferase (GGCT)/AIG2-like uncharacterized protein YtfP
MTATLLFVYGTLKRGLANNSLLAGQKFVTEARTLPHYRLYDTGLHPCLVEDIDHGLAVQGEIWHVDDATLARLDTFEEIPDRFDRRPVGISGFSAPVSAYFYQGDVSGLKDCGDHWPDLPHP